MPKIIKTKKGVALWQKAKKLIPGGTQLLSKRSEQFLPDLWPSYFKKAKGVEVWDLDGNKFVDMSYMALGACTLGYADPDVNRAVGKVIKEGSMCTLNSPEEVELAELFLKIHPWAQEVRYARTGGEAMAVAVRIARAYKEKDKLAFCGYHGWSDWYLAANLADNKNLDGQLLPGLDPAGVPRGLKDTAIPFHYNKIEELEEIVKENDIGVIVMEPRRDQPPEDGFLEKVRQIADRIGAVLVFDEVSAGFRMNNGGIHLVYRVNPDLAVFAKGISNGYPMAVILGKKEVMDAAQKTFISSTYWTERVGPSAALATIRKFQKYNVSSHLVKMGKMIKEGWLKSARKHGLDIEVGSFEPMIGFKFHYDQDSQALHTLFNQEMLARGFLVSKNVYLSFAHQPKHIQDYLKNADGVFGLIKEAIIQKKIYQLLKGPVAHQGFKRLT